MELVMCKRDCQGSQKCISRFPNTKKTLGSTIGKAIRGGTKVCIFPDAFDSGQRGKKTVMAGSM